MCRFIPLFGGIAMMQTSLTSAWPHVNCQWSLTSLGEIIVYIRAELNEGIRRIYLRIPSIRGLRRNSGLRSADTKVYRI